MGRASCLFWSILMACAVPSVAQAVSVMPFEGSIDLQTAEASLVFGPKDDQRVRMDFARVSPRQYRLNLDLRHLDMPLFDVSAEIEGNFQMSGLSRDRLELAGEVKSRYTLLNYKPVRDLYLKFAFRDQKFIVETFFLGTLSAKGSVDLLGEKKRIDVSLELLSADIEDIETFASDQMQLDTPSLTGIISGTMDLNGLLVRPDIRGRLVFYNGRFKKFSYENIVLDFTGSYPVLRLNEGIVTQNQGMSFRIAGAVDISNLGGLGVQLRLLEVTPIASTTGLRREWVLKRLRSEDDSTTELKYFLTGDDWSDPAGVLGVQKKIDF